ncbi:helix-turn-helix domain-containing protein [Streptomyces sp. TRM43335]|uniref:Helix-turn-helix domain-containing protein n=1 Tax=Streptomyces taklimakanensis TaxID=2569853 RepID=A0A6G2BL03_9ACTN|nr:helix-turn-helix domain-containing protein [Streptomyces taklimakanensis]MTE22582.1 helix-turn-helix domain-containing protein [Streptomyces taklimakanensis]
MTTATREWASGVGVLDKASALLEIVEQAPAPLSELVSRSGLARPTAYRIAVALERLGLLTRDSHGRFVLGPRLGTLAVEARYDRLARAAAPVLAELHAATGLEARVLRRRGRVQICVATSADGVAGSGGTEKAPVGTARPVTAGAVALVLLAWEDPEEIYHGLRGARFTAGQLSQVRRRGWARGADVMVPGEVAYAVPVRIGDGRVVAALSVSGTPSRMDLIPSRRLGAAVFDSAAELGDALQRAHTAPAAPRGRYGRTASGTR